MSLLRSYRPTNKQVSMRHRWKIHLDGHWLLIARLLWVIVVLGSLGTFVMGIFSYYARPSVSGDAIRAILLHPAFSMNGYTAFFRQLFFMMSGPTTFSIALAALSSLVWIAVGGVVFWCGWRKSEPWLTLFVSLTLILFGVNFSPFLFMRNIPEGMHSHWWLPITCIQTLSYILIGFFFWLFPDGRFVPRRAYWIALCNVAYQVFFVVPTNSPLSIVHWPPLVFAFVEVSFILAFMLIQLYRYRLISGAIAHQQTKWVVYGMAVVMMAYILLLLLMLFFPSLARTGSYSFLLQSADDALLFIVMFPIPITIGIAMLHYRLWDVDVLINRTLVYGLLTLVLALVYFGCVILLQQLFQVVTGQGSSLAIVGSTLVIVGLCQPLRRRIQTALDRRFYRRKYDAARIVTAFSARLRERGDLDMTILTNDLEAVVEETMQPEYVSLWMCNSRHIRGPKSL